MRRWDWGVTTGAHMCFILIQCDDWLRLPSFNSHSARPLSAYWCSGKYWCTFSVCAKRGSRAVAALREPEAYFSSTKQRKRASSLQFVFRPFPFFQFHLSAAGVRSVMCWSATAMPFRGFQTPFWKTGKLMTLILSEALKYLHEGAVWWRWAEKSEHKSGNL